MTLDSFLIFLIIAFVLCMPFSLHELFQYFNDLYYRKNLYDFDRDIREEYIRLKKLESEIKEVLYSIFDFSLCPSHLTLQCAVVENRCIVYKVETYYNRMLDSVEVTEYFMIKDVVSMMSKHGFKYKV